MRTEKGYKLFEMDREGNLHALFIDAKEVTPIGQWVKAKYVPTKGFAKRGGWHIGQIPDAPWLKGYDGTYHSKRTGGKRIWCEVTYNATKDYNEEVARTKKKCFEDKVPEDGYYFFKEVGKGVWVITSDIKINRILTETERKQILADMNYSEEETFAPYKEAFQKRIATNNKKKEVM